MTAKPEYGSMQFMYDDFDDLPRDCEVPFENMSEDEYIYRLMNQEAPLYMSPDIDVDDLPDWD